VASLSSAAQLRREPVDLSALARRVAVELQPKGSGRAAAPTLDDEPGRRRGLLPQRPPRLPDRAGALP
jgi:hypothetical protein